MQLKFTLRSLRKRPFLNFIKVLGLCLSFGGFLLISLFLKNELTYESFNENSERTYRLTVNYESQSEQEQFARVSNTEFLPEMAEFFPGIENYARLAPVRGGVIGYNNEFYTVNEAFECDSTFFSVFPAQLLTGEYDKALASPRSAVISESFAGRLFGKTDPTGKILTLPAGQFYGESVDFTITGVMKDFPQNSHFHPEFIATPADKSIFSGWAWTYLLLADNINPEDISSEFKGFFSQYLKAKPEEIEFNISLQKIADIHLHSAKLREIEENSSMYVIYSLSIAALILLLTGLSNYANLNMGMAAYSDKYLFISKITGSAPGKYRSHFFAEAIIIVLTSVLFGCIISGIAGRILLKYSGLNLFRENEYFISGIILVFIISAVISGVVPLLRQKVSGLLKRGQSGAAHYRGRNGLSRSIIILQFVICSILIISLIIIHNQKEYALQSGMGYNNDNLICFKDVHSNTQKKFEVFKHELLKISSVESVTAMMDPPGGEANDAFEFKMEGYIPEAGNERDNYIGVLPCDYSFVSAFGLNLLGGDDFSPTNADNPGSGEYIINESAMKRLHFSKPDQIIGKRFTLKTNIPGIDLPEGRITGVVKDFHLSGIRKRVGPLVLFKRSDLWLLNFVVAFRPGMKEKAVNDVRNVWNKMFPGYPFQFEYINSMYKSVYKGEILQSLLLSVFTIISVFICSMGLLGMSLLSTQKRTKEIGLRKINGATSGELVLMLTWEIVRYVFIAFLIAVPFAYLGMHLWLQNFAYRTEPGLWIFLLSALIALSVAFFTVSVQTFKAASRNPVEALRYE